MVLQGALEDVSYYAGYRDVYTNPYVRAIHGINNGSWTIIRDRDKGLMVADNIFTQQTEPTA